MTVLHHIANGNIIHTIMFYNKLLPLNLLTSLEQFQQMKTKIYPTSQFFLTSHHENCHTGKHYKTKKTKQRKDSQHIHPKHTILE